MVIEFNPLVVVGAGAICCAFVAFAVARRSTTGRVLVETTRGGDLAHKKPALADVYAAPPRYKQSSWKEMMPVSASWITRDGIIEGRQRHEAATDDEVFLEVAVTIAMPLLHKGLPFHSKGSDDESFGKCAAEYENTSLEYSLGLALVPWYHPTQPSLREIT